MPFLPKRLIICVVEDAQVEAVVAAIVRVNQTGNPGDGKIFVLPLEDATSIEAEQEKAVSVG